MSQKKFDTMGCFFYFLEGANIHFKDVIVGNLLIEKIIMTTIVFGQGKSNPYTQLWESTCVSTNDQIW